MESENKETVKNANSNMYDLIFKEDDITWQSMIYELAREGKVNPWDIDLSELSKEFLKTLLKLKEMNFHLSGKVVLAAAILLKLKSDRLGLEQLLALTNPVDELEAQDGGYDASDENSFVSDAEKHFGKASLQPRIPGVRKRKVTMFELVEALKQAIDVDARRRFRISDVQRDIPDKIKNVQKVDIFERINQVYLRLLEFLKNMNCNNVTFTDIVPSKEKKDIIWTFIPLLHLMQQRKIKISQKEHFGKIVIGLYDKQAEDETVENGHVGNGYAENESED